MTLIHSAGELNYLPALFTCHPLKCDSGATCASRKRLCGPKKLGHESRHWILTVEQSSLLTRIATVNASLCVRMRSSLPFLELEAVTKLALRSSESICERSFELH